MINGVPVVTAPAEIDITAAEQLRELRLVVPAGGAVARIIGLSCLDYLIPCYVSLAGALALAARPGPAQLAALAAAAVEPRARALTCLPPRSPSRHDRTPA